MKKISILLITLLLIVTGCRAIKEIEQNYTTLHDTVYIAKKQVDTVKIATADTVLINTFTKADTVFCITDRIKWRDRYIYQGKTDTVFKTKVDTVYRQQQIEVTKPDKSTFKFGYLAGAGITILLGVLFFFIYRAAKNLR